VITQHVESPVCVLRSTVDVFQDSQKHSEGPLFGLFFVFVMQFSSTVRSEIAYLSIMALNLQGSFKLFDDLDHKYEDAFMTDPLPKI